MSRDGGFALLASVRQALANQLLAAFAAGVTPRPITVPPITVGGAVVNISGTLSLLPPTVSFRNRADGLVTTTVSVGALVSVAATGQPSQLVNAVFSTSVDVPLTTNVVNNQVVASINLTQVTVNQFGVQYLSAPPSPLFQNAVSSPAIVAALNAFLQQLAPLPLTIPLMSTSTNTAVSRGAPPGQDPHYHYRNRSTFPPYPPRFAIQLAVSRVVLRQFDGAVTAAADLNGITNGDPTQIVDLTSTWSPLTSMVEQENYDLSVSSGSSGPGVPNTPVVVLTSSAVFASVLANQVSPRLDAGPCIDDHVLIHSVSADLGWYNAPDPFGTGYGLTAKLDVTYYTGTSEDGLGYFWPGRGLHSPASVKVYVRVLGYDPYNRPGQWRLEIVTVDISLPWWLTIPLISTTVLFFYALPLFVGLESAAAIGLAGGVNGIVQAAELGVASAGNTALTKATISAVQSVTIPGTTISATIDVWNYGFSSEGAESWLKVSAGNSAVSNQGINLQLNGRVLPTGTSQTDIFYNDPTLDLQVVIAPSFSDPSSVFTQWSILRKDTNTVIASKVSRLSDPGGGSLSISRVTPALQAVSAFAISVTIFQPGVVASYNVDVKVVDWLDRRRRFVRWTSHTWFADPKKPKQWIYYWERTRPSRIHRTDWPGRCRRLSPPSSILPALMSHDWPTPLAKNKYWAQFVPERWSYVDALPFANAEQAVAGRRGVLCDYCFFGGPTKNGLLVSVPYPIAEGLGDG